MKKLTVAQVKVLGDHRDKVEKYKGKLEHEIDHYNDVLRVAWNDVDCALRDLNSAIEDADEFRAYLAADMDTYFDERTETWQESDAGEEYGRWRDEWGWDLEEAEIDEPSELDMPDVEGLDRLRELPEEPSS